MPSGNLNLNSSSNFLAQGHGEQWCNGECFWIYGQCMNQKEKGKFLEAQANFYSSDDYVKDETTNLMMAPTTEETCKANDGFVCKVKLKSKNDNIREALKNYLADFFC